MTETTATAAAGAINLPDASSDHAPGHVLPVRVLLGIFAVLMVLTAVTVAVSMFDFGQFNLWIAIGLATIKASLVALYFMHLRYDHPMNALVFVTALVFLGLFVSIVLLDTVEYQGDVRDWSQTVIGD